MGSLSWQYATVQWDRRFGTGTARRDEKQSLLQPFPSTAPHDVLLSELDLLKNGLFWAQNTCHRNSTRLHNQKLPAHIPVKSTSLCAERCWSLQLQHREVWKGSSVENTKHSLTDTEDKVMHLKPSLVDSKCYSCLFWPTEKHWGILLAPSWQPLLQKQQLPICTWATGPARDALGKSSACLQIFPSEGWTDLFQAAMQELNITALLGKIPSNQFMSYCISFPFKPYYAAYHFITSQCHKLPFNAKQSFSM